MPYQNDLQLPIEYRRASSVIEDALTSLNQECVATGMSTSELTSNYLTVGFGGVVPERCDFLLVVLTDDTVYISVDDGATWLVIFDPSAIGIVLVVVGTVIEYGGDENNVPTGWLLCDGSEVSQTTYADLHTEIGTVFGTAAAPGVDFVLPDLRAKSPRGVNFASYGNGANGSFATTALGDTAGIETHQLVESEMPSHLHTGNRPNNNQGARTQVVALVGRYSAGSSTGSEGGDTAHNELPPSLSVNYIIKT